MSCSQFEYRTFSPNYSTHASTTSSTSQAIFSFAALNLLTSYSQCAKTTCAPMRTAEFDFALAARTDRANAGAGARSIAPAGAGSRHGPARPPAIFSICSNISQPGDVLVLNDSRVIPARLRGRNVRTGGKFEVLLLEENAVNDWWAMLRPGKRARPGTKIEILDRKRKAPSSSQPRCWNSNAEGHRRLQFSGDAKYLDRLGGAGRSPAAALHQPASRPPGGPGALPNGLCAGRTAPWPRPPPACISRRSSWKKFAGAG